MTLQIEESVVFIFMFIFAVAIIDYNSQTVLDVNDQKAPAASSASWSPKPDLDFTDAFTLAAPFWTLNTIGAILRMSEDLPAMAFTVTLYVILMNFFWCVSAFEKKPHDSKNRERLKILVWVLATTLNLMCTYRVWTMVRPSVVLGLLVWGVVGIGSVVTFYFFFVFGDKKTWSEECGEQV